MKYSTNVKAFRDAFGIVRRVIPSKSPKPILMNAKFRVSEDGAELSATDLERGIRHPIAGGQVIEPGVCLLPGEVTDKILRSADESTLTIETEGDKVKVACGKAKWSVATEDEALFPEVPELTGDAQVTLAPADLIRLVERTKHAVDLETTKYALGGLNVSIQGNAVRFAATDGRRIATQDSSADLGGSLVGNPVIPASFADLMVAVAKAVDDLVEIRIDDRCVQVRIGRSTLYGRLVEGRFPKYEDAFPDGVATKIGDIDPDLLAAALGQVKATEDDASRGVDFLFSTGLLGLTHTSERGRSEVEFPITYEGRDIPVTFDARYLSDVVKGLSGHPLTVEIIDHKSPIVVRTEDGFASVIMPLTRDR